MLSIVTRPNATNRAHNQTAKRAVVRLMIRRWLLVLLTGIVAALPAQAAQAASPPVKHGCGSGALSKSCRRKSSSGFCRTPTRKTDAPELQKASLVMRAQSYRRRMFAEFEKVHELLLP